MVYIHLGRHPEPGIHLGGGLVHHLLHPPAPRLVEGTHRSLHIGPVGHHVGRPVGRHPSDRHDGGQLRIGIRGGNVVEQPHQLGPCPHRVLDPLPKGGMPSDAVHTETELVARRHVFSFPETERSRLQHGFHVLSDERHDTVSVERTLLHHQRGPARIQLLARLEESEHRTAEEVAVTVEYLQRPEQNGRVHVVSAGVHHPLVNRREFGPGRLRNGQRIHVGPQHERLLFAPRTRFRPLDAGEDARSRHAAVFDSLVLQRLGDDLRRAVFLERKFRVLMQIPAPHHHMQELSERLVDDRLFLPVCHISAGLPDPNCKTLYPTNIPRTASAQEPETSPATFSPLPTTTRRRRRSYPTFLGSKRPASRTSIPRRRA